MWWREHEPGALGEAFGELDRMRRDMERLFHSLDARAGLERSAGVFPLLNLTHDDDSFFVRAELPGVNANELNLATTNNRLTLSGTREIPAESDNVSYHRRERSGGTFNRTITLPGGFDAERVSASYANGILSIELPKTAAQRPRQISVTTA